MSKRLRHSVEAILQQGIRYSQEGNTNSAVECYRQVRAQQPRHPYACYLLGLHATRQCDTAKAIELIGTAIKEKPDEPVFYYALGQVHDRCGSHASALAAYDKLLSLSSPIPPQLAMHTQHRKGMTLRHLNQLEAAIACFQKAIQSGPPDIQIHLDLANLLRQQGKLDLSVKYLEELVSKCPASADAHLNLGHARLILNRYESALAEYQQAIKLQPGEIEPCKGEADVLLRLGQHDEAQVIYKRIFEKRFGHGICQEHTLNDLSELSSETIPRKTDWVSTFYLEEIIGHIEYLVDRKLIDPSFIQISGLYRKIRARIPKSADPNYSVMLTPKEYNELSRFHRRTLYYQDSKPVAPPVVNDQLGVDDIESRYLSSPTAVITADNFLTQSAFEALRDFCLQSTIFFEQSISGFLPSYVDQGFNCSLLYQIASELKDCFPRILHDKELTNIWIYRHPNKTCGVKSHTDDGAVTFNFWITADTSNLDPEHGGLLVYIKEQPDDWDWYEFNYKKHLPQTQKKVSDFLETAQVVKIPYRENRALLFHSNLFHKSDSIHFKDSYLDRRMNITLLFGDRQKHIGEGIRTETAN